MKLEPKQSLNISHRVERLLAEEYVVLTFERGEFRNPVTLRIYEQKAASYACLWCNDERLGYANGSGRANGYGFYRSNEAVQKAFEAAGFREFESIAERDGHAVKELLHAIARELLKVQQYTIHVAHP